MKKMLLLYPLLVGVLFAQPDPPAKKQGPPKDWSKRPWEEKAVILTEYFSPKPGALKKMDQAIEALPTLSEGAPFKVLVFYRCGGFTHTSIVAGNEAFKRIAQKTGAFTVDFSDQKEDLLAENLHQYDVLLLNNTTRLALAKLPEAQESILSFMEAGKGFVGIHAAADNFYDWPEGRALIGGTFNGHPWNANKTWVFQLETPTHPVIRGFGQKGFTFQDEIYAYTPDSFSRDRSRVLVSLDMDHPQNHEAKFHERYLEQFGTDPLQYDTPVSWVHPYAQGRVFYTTFGHRAQTFEQASMLEHYYRGLLYAAGKLEADDLPSAQIKTVFAKPLAPSAPSAQR